jgi:hypothetical protein
MTPKACSAERALVIVRVRSLLNGSVRHTSETSTCEQSRALASAEQASVLAYLTYVNKITQLKSYLQNKALPT